MKIRRGDLGFDIPVQIHNKIPYIEMTPEAIMSWRAKLHMADVGETAKEIYLALSEANQVELPVDSRFQILELFRPPLQLIYQALKKHYLIEASILTKQKLAIAKLAQTLQLEMAYGYKLIIEELAKNGIKEIAQNDETEILPIAIHRTMHYFTLVLLRCYQLYSTAPSGLWRELHLLYKYAADKDLLKYAVTIDIGNTKQTVPLMTTYKHALLLSATNPYQWRQNEQEVINNALDLWAPYATLISYHKSYVGKAGIYIIHLDQDLPPSPLGLNDIAPNQNSILIDLRKETSHLKEILAEMTKNEISARLLHNGDPEYEIAIPTLTKLLNVWQSYIVRRHRRYKVSGVVNIVFGLYAIYYYLNDEQPFAAKMLNSSGMNNDKASINIIEPATLATAEAAEEIVLIPVSEAAESTLNSTKYPMYQCTLVDVSPTGACVVIDENSYPPVQAGEIIIMRPEKSLEQTYWNVGVVRWLKHTEDSALKVGIQILAKYGKAVTAQILKNTVGSGYFLRCLLLPESEDLDTPSTIITPTIPFKVGKTINLNVNFAPTGKIIQAVLAKEIDCTGSFRQFEYHTEEKLDLLMPKISHKTTATTPAEIVNAGVNATIALQKTKTITTTQSTYITIDENKADKEHNTTNEAKDASKKYSLFNIKLRSPLSFKSKTTGTLKTSSTAPQQSAAAISTSQIQSQQHSTVQNLDQRSTNKSSGQISDKNNNNKNTIWDDLE